LGRRKIGKPIDFAKKNCSVEDQSSKVARIRWTATSGRDRPTIP
jgi:hypothetical protein